MRLIVLLSTLLVLSCSGSSDDGDKGSSGGASSGGSGGSLASGGAASDAGCADGGACSACLETQCASEISTCSAKPSCEAARSDLGHCLEVAPCAPNNCWGVFQTSGGSLASAVRSCAATSCAQCAP